MSRCKFRPGDDTWVVERDDAGFAVEVTGFMFLAEAVGYAIVSSFINDYESIEDTMDYLYRDSVESCGCDLYVFPIEDCYYTREEAQEIYDAECDE